MLLSVDFAEVLVTRTTKRPLKINDADRLILIFYVNFWIYILLLAIVYFHYNVYPASFLLSHGMHIVWLYSFSLLWGPVNHLKHLLSVERLPFTVSYFGTMVATLYFALSVSIVFVITNSFICAGCLAFDF